MTALREWPRVRDGKGRNLPVQPKRPVVRMTGRLLNEYRLPWWYRIGYREYDTDCYVVAWPGLHYLLRAHGFWRHHRWDGERLGLRLGFFVLKEEGGYFSEGRWTVRRVKGKR